MAYIYPGPGAADKQVVLKIREVLSSGVRYLGEELVVAGLQDITVNAANDVFTWTQLDSSAKKQIATTATNSLSMNLVVDQTAFFGGDFITVINEAALPTSGMTAGQLYYATDEASYHVATSDTTTIELANRTPVPALGILGASTNKTRVEFELYFGDTSDNAEGKFITSTGYITGLAPTVSADAPVWVTPITITVDDDYTISDTLTFPIS